MDFPAFGNATGIIIGVPEFEISLNICNASGFLY